MPRSPILLFSGARGVGRDTTRPRILFFCALAIPVLGACGDDDDVGILPDASAADAARADGGADDDAGRRDAGTDGTTDAGAIDGGGDPDGGGSSDCRIVDEANLTADEDSLYGEWAFAPSGEPVIAFVTWPAEDAVVAIGRRSGGT